MVIGAAEEARLARTVLREYLGVRAGELVTLEAWSRALPWARPFVAEARRLDAVPILAVEEEEEFFRSLERQAHVPTAPAALALAGGPYVYFPGPEAFPRLFGLGPSGVRAALDRHAGAWAAAARASGVRAFRLVLPTATPLAAARLGVRFDVWRSELLRASFVRPRQLAREAAQLTGRLARARTLSVRHANGSRLTVALRPGRWRAETGGPTGRAVRPPTWTDLPTGRLVLPVRSGSATGTWEANRPAYDRLAEPAVAVGARLVFEGGRLGEISFDRGGAAVADRYGGVRRPRNLLSAISIGLNPGLRRTPEVEEYAFGRVGLWLRERVPGPTAAGPNSAFISVLEGADVELDGRPWLVAGRPIVRARPDRGLKRPRPRAGARVRGRA